MTTPEYESFLPEVEKIDIRYLIFDDVTNTDHSERWDTFASIHPVLAAELRARITIEAKASAEYDENREDIRIRMMRVVVFAVNALEQAGRRGKQQSPDSAKIVDVDGEDQQLST